VQSQNYAPSDALLPYIRRFYVFETPLPDDMVIEDFLLAETAFVRLLLGGDWSAEMTHGDWRTAGKCVFFGGNEKPLKARVKGSFLVAGFAVRPSGWTSLFTQSHRTVKDQMLPLQFLWGDLADKMFSEVAAAPNDLGKVAAMERAIAARLAEIGKYKPDDLMAQFEVIARTDSTMKIEDAAAQLGISVRQMERRCLESFGMSPKAILRRSRFLDMAAAMRGFSTPSQAQLAELRYFDQSHINREFRRFSGMTPGKFAKAVTPLQTAGLKLREEGKWVN
jgi:AraC-like DNA-binding protein